MVVLVIVPAAFGRLCVETHKALKHKAENAAQPPSGGCVLKLAGGNNGARPHASRLRAAVC